MTQSTKLFSRTVINVLHKLGTYGPKLAGYYASGAHDKILQLREPCPSADTFIEDYAAYNLLRKYDGLNVDIDTKAVALAKWIEADELCKVHNETWDAGNRRAGALVFYAQRKISQILGSFCPDEFVASIDHSGGASTQRKRRSSSSANKESDNQYVTLGAHGLLRAVQLHNGYYATPVIRNFSKFTTVPKDAKTDRPIIIENQGNMLMQKAIGSMIRRRLKRVGINLNDQSNNQRAAGKLHNATIDLSSASDSIWSCMIPLLLPKPWSDVIIDTRSPAVQIGGQIRELHKIGGMGNGFVFELESLIFYAITYAAIQCSYENGPCRPTDILVYGDDIIVDVSHAQTVCAALETFGFTINRSKSFWSGPFRESCGYHYHNERCITPVYIKHFDNTLGAWYHLYNSLSELSQRIGICFDDELTSIEAYLRKHKAFNYVPESFGLRSGIRAPFDVAQPKPVRCPRNRKKPWVQGYAVKHLVNKPREYVVCQLGAYLRTLRRASGRIPEPVVYWPRRSNSVKVPCYFTTEVLDLGDDYNNNRGSRLFNIRTAADVGEEVFSVSEISFW